MESERTVTGRLSCIGFPCLVRRAEMGRRSRGGEGKEDEGEEDEEGKEAEEGEEAREDAGELSECRPEVKSGEYCANMACA